MKPKVIFLILLLIGTAVLVRYKHQPAESVDAATCTVAPGTFCAAFGGAPTTPAPYLPAGWDVQRHSRNLDTWAAPEMMEAQHGPGCEPPGSTGTMTHHIMDWDSTVFQCKDHLMTAIKAGGYGVIYLTPPALADFSAGEAVISVDVSTLRTSFRDWWDIWVTPYTDNLALPFDMGDVDLRGNPRNGIHIVMDQFADGTIFRGSTFSNYVSTDLRSMWVTPYESLLTASAARRDTFQLHVSATHIKFGIRGNPGVVGAPQTDFWYIDQDIAPLAWNQGVVQLGHHSYNPQKDCPASSPCLPNTWHWNNVRISPAVPFSIQRVPVRMVQTSDDYPLPAAPAGAMLRFAAVSGGLDVSFDGGVNWQAATVQPGSLETTVDVFHADNYWMPVPAGATRVRFRNRQNGYWGSDWAVFDPFLWSRAAVASTATTVPPTATATSTPTMTATASATASATATATSTPTATATQTATPTATPRTVVTATPTATATASASATTTKTATATPTSTTCPRTGCCCTTATPTTTPTPTAISTTSWTLGATVTSSVVSRGTSVGITGTVRSVLASTALVDIEIYDASNNKVFQQTFDNQSFTPGVSRSFTATWQTTTANPYGAYTVKVGIFSPGWGTLISWNNRAASINLSR